MLANCVTAVVSHMTYGNSSELFLLAQICFVRLMLFPIGACLVFIASTKCKIGLLPRMVIRISVMPVPQILLQVQKLETERHGNKAKKVPLNMFLVVNVISFKVAVGETTPPKFNS